MTKTNLFNFLTFVIFSICQLGAQNPFLPHNLDTSKIYLFYLHGGIVNDQDMNPVSPYYGPYNYLDILDTLSGFGFHVISEARPKSIIEIEYAEKVSRQVDSLLQASISEKNIFIVGASLGAYIIIEIAHQLKNPRINYAVIGLCSEYAVEYYLKYKRELCGNFLSIYEATDEKSSCHKILNEQQCKTGFKEIRLNMGISHAFLYKPYKEWIVPLVKWIDDQ